MYEVISIEERITRLLHSLCDPTTPNTVPELFSRFDGIGWDQCLPILNDHLQSPNPDIVRLVLNVLRFRAEQESQKIPKISSLLCHDDPLVRQSVIALLSALKANDPETISVLHQVVNQDEPQLAVEAAIAIIQLEPDEADGLIPLLKVQLASRDPMIIRLITDSIEFFGDRADEFRDQLMGLLDYETVADNAALAILRITGDDAHARDVVFRWRQSDDVVQHVAAAELHQEIEAIVSGSA